ncbi:MAG: glycosyltransferase family 2 protein [Saprospiraceae bacterium]|nr:glycosyltransferase family 2 protein [Saprospiraceae bacterium]
MLLQIIAYLIIGLYTVALVYITFYCLIQFHLLLKYYKGRKSDSASKDELHYGRESLPFITIQLPVFNERFVVERLIDNIITMDYPSDKLEIQVLDDSTDDTTEVCKRKVAEFKNKGVDIVYIHRTNREGFKAGALRDGLKVAKGAFIAIFDADFLPHKDFLLKTIPYFKDKGVGVVQTRWEHINGDYSLITRLQAFQLNVHFSIEQSGRQAGNYLLQFNGTAGVWRRHTILDAGGWEADTLTEDLDLSYRAQLKGWKIVYRQDIASPAELPVEMNGLKSQQFRWMKGGAENARKLIPAVLKSDLPFAQKIHATTHLLSSSIFLVVFALAVLSVPTLFLISTIKLDMRVYWIFMLGMLAVGWVYFVANSDTSWVDEPPLKRVMTFVFLFPLFLSLSMGLSLHNSIAVLQGLRGKKSAFVRTPKFNIQQVQDTFKKGFYGSGSISGPTIFEGLLALYFLSAVVMGIALGKTSFLIYHIMLMIGFGSIFYYTIRHLSHR